MKGGKYEDVCEKVRKQTQAEGCILLIIEGNRGHGFAVQATVEITMRLPQMLRYLADKIEVDLDGRIADEIVEAIAKASGEN